MLQRVVICLVTDKSIAVDCQNFSSAFWSGYNAACGAAKPRMCVLAYVLVR